MSVKILHQKAGIWKIIDCTLFFKTYLTGWWNRKLAREPSENLHLVKFLFKRGLQKMLLASILVYTK